MNLSSIISGGVTWGLAYLLAFSGSYMADQYNDFVSQIVGPEPELKESCKIKKVDDLDECHIKLHQQWDQFKNLAMSNNPWIVFDEIKYRKIKSELNLAECPSSKTIQNDDFSDCEQNLTLRERHKLKKSFVHWAILGLLMSLIFFVFRKLQGPLRRWLEKRLP